MKKEERIEFIKAWIEQNENMVTAGNDLVARQKLEIRKAELRIDTLQKMLKETELQD